MSMTSSEAVIGNKIYNLTNMILFILKSTIEMWLFFFSLGFVLVIQEKDLVQLKIVKQQYRRTVKKANELKNKTDGNRVNYTLEYIQYT